MPLPRALALFLFACLAVFGPVRHARAQAPTSRNYEDWVRDALEAQKGGDFERAHGCFAEAHALRPNARTLRGMGVSSFQAGRDLRAIAELEAALTHPEKPLDAELRAAVDDLITRARARLGVVTVKASPDHARVYVDDGADANGSNVPIQMEAGPHTLRIRADGHAEQSLGIDVGPATNQTVRVTLALEASAAPAPAPERRAVSALTPIARTPAPSPRMPAHRRRLLGAYGTLGLAAALELTAGALWLSFKYVRLEEVRRVCAEQPCTSEAAVRAQANAAGIRRFERATMGLGIVAGVSAALSLSLFTWDYYAEGKHVSLRLSGSGAELRGHF